MEHLQLGCPGQSELGSPGLEQSMLGCTVVEQSELGSPGVEQSELGCPGVEQSELGCPGVEQLEPGRFGLEQSMLGCPVVQQSELGCAEVYQSELCRLGAGFQVYQHLTVVEHWDLQAAHTVEWSEQVAPWDIRSQDRERLQGQKHMTSDRTGREPLHTAGTLDSEILASSSAASSGWGNLASLDKEVAGTPWAVRNTEGTAGWDELGSWKAELQAVILGSLHHLEHWLSYLGKKRKENIVIWARFIFTIWTMYQV